MIPSTADRSLNPTAVGRLSSGETSPVNRLASDGGAFWVSRDYTHALFSPSSSQLQPLHPPTVFSFIFTHYNDVSIIPFLLLTASLTHPPKPHPSAPSPPTPHRLLVLAVFGELPGSRHRQVTVDRWLDVGFQGCEVQGGIIWTATQFLAFGIWGGADREQSAGKRSVSCRDISIFFTVSPSSWPMVTFWEGERS